MDTWEYHITVADDQREILLAYLTELPFYSFTESPGGIQAYLSDADKSLTFDQEVLDLVRRFQAHLEVKRLPAVNWNERWEANFHPIVIDTFCGVRAEFHAPIADVRYEIIINPKMAFGTGHHDTTYMMLSAMRSLPMRNAKVLDYGCGTGILAILAAKMGATMIDAVDIEKAAYENTLENLQINDAFNVQVLHGSLEIILDNKFDIILANINRNVILDSLSALHKKLHRSGRLLISGILRQDEDLILQTARKAGFTVDEKYYRHEWCCFLLLQ